MVAERESSDGPGPLRDNGAPARVAAPRSALRRVRADALFAGTRELIIEHGPDEYRLRLTSKGKLILTK